MRGNPPLKKKFINFHDAVFDLDSRLVVCLDWNEVHLGPKKLIGVQSGTDAWCSVYMYR